jgi:hypothetical protein
VTDGRPARCGRRVSPVARREPIGGKSSYRLRNT